MTSFFPTVNGPAHQYNPDTGEEMMNSLLEGFSDDDMEDTPYVKSVFVVHVGCTRCVASNPDHTMHRQARITVGVGCTRACIVLF